MERKIGEIFEYNGEWYQCVEGLYCDNCAFVNDNCEDRERITLREKLTKQPTTGFCNSEKRNDRKSVIFKKLEKVGEPFKRNGYLYQEYKAHTYPLLMNGEAKLPTANGFAVKIKQTKENMEEQHTIENYPTKEEKIAERIANKVGKEIQNQLEKNLKLKPFNLEQAKAGKPVCTRDGRKARIICFDAKGDKPIIALIEYEIDERPCNYFANGRFYSNPNENNDADLMMLPEKKEGWVNIYYEHDAPSHREANWVYDKEEEAIKVGKEHGSCYIATVRIEWDE